MKTAYDAQAFGDRVLHKRQELGLSQMELAEAAGISAASVIAYEKGQKTPTIGTAAELASVLNVSLDWLCGFNKKVYRFKLENLGDAVDIFEMLSEITGNDPESVDLPLPEVMYIPLGYDEDGKETWETTEKATRFDFPNYKLAKFFEGKNKMRNLLRDGTITGEIFDSWKAGEMEKLRKIKFPVEQEYKPTASGDQQPE